MSIKFLFCENKVVSLDSAISHLNDSGIWNAFDERAVTFINKFKILIRRRKTIYNNKFRSVFYFRQYSPK